MSRGSAKWGAHLLRWMLTPALVCLLPFLFFSVMMLIDLLLSSEVLSSFSLIAFLGLVLGVVIRKQSTCILRMPAMWSLLHFVKSLGALVEFFSILMGCSVSYKL